MIFPVSGLIYASKYDIFLITNVSVTSASVAAEKTSETMLRTNDAFAMM
jgi:hypothetical protein